MTAIEIHGRWWLPEHEDHEVFGVMKWDLETGGTLRLQGELRPPEWVDHTLEDDSVQRLRRQPWVERDRQYPVIQGRSERRAYTLLDSFSLSIREYGEDAVENVHVNRWAEGAWFTDLDDFQADRVIVDLRHLTGWTCRSGLSVDFRRPVDDAPFAVITARSIPILNTDVDGFDLRLVQSLEPTGDHIHDIGVAQQWHLKLTHPSPAAVDEFTDVVSDFQDLLTIAVGRTADIEKVVIQHPAVPALSLAGTVLADRDDIILYTRWSNRSVPDEPTEPVSRHRMYFTLDDLGGIEGVGRWMRVAAKYRTELGRAMATRYSDAMYLEDRIMNLTAALDSLDRVHRETGNWNSLEDRLTNCVESAGQPFRDLIVVGAERWIASIVTTRNDLAHHKDAFRTAGRVGEHLQAEQLFWLFAMCLLRIAEVPEAVFDAIAKHGQIRWLVEQATNSTSADNDGAAK